MSNVGVDCEHGYELALSAILGTLTLASIVLIKLNKFEKIGSINNQIGIKEKHVLLEH